MFKPHQSELSDEKLACGCAIDGDERCEFCCEHTDICTDERICLDCSKDMTEHFMAMAEAYYEGDR